jgi:hypothetical protein
MINEGESGLAPNHVAEPGHAQAGPRQLPVENRRHLIFKMTGWRRPRGAPESRNARRGGSCLARLARRPPVLPPYGISACGHRPGGCWMPCAASVLWISVHAHYGGEAVTKFTVLCAMVGLALDAAACVSPQQQVALKEDLLAAAGFQVRPADSPHRIAAMKRLPAQKFVTKVVNGNPVYLYADPLDCDCVYFGNQQNWDAYKQEMFAKQLADQAQMTAIMNQEAWDWGPWGYP